MSTASATGTQPKKGLSEKASRCPSRNLCRFQASTSTLPPFRTSRPTCLVRDRAEPVGPYCRHRHHTNRQQALIRVPTCQRRADPAPRAARKAEAAAYAAHRSWHVVDLMLLRPCLPPCTATRATSSVSSDLSKRIQCSLARGWFKGHPINPECRSQGPLLRQHQWQHRALPPQLVLRPRRRPVRQRRKSAARNC